MILRGLLLRGVPLLVLAVSVGACGTGTSSGSADGASGTGVPDDLGEVADLTGRAEVTIEVVDNSYKPRAAKVSPGTKITFVDTGVNPHNVTPNEDGAFSAVAVVPGQSAVVTAPAAPQTYRYYCTIHGGRTSGQRGAIVVAPPA
jgi:plastocyanin